ncbi:MAG: hypothetical protein K2P14_10310 [Anaeroplasmataceae bacterium]|nr:hypothetical protein [Anaeroplasmataceae bacterium]
MKHDITEIYTLYYPPYRIQVYDTVYTVPKYYRYDDVFKRIIKRIEILEWSDGTIDCELVMTDETGEYEYRRRVKPDSFGKDIFTTQKEAEAYNKKRKQRSMKRKR